MDTPAERVFDNLFSDYRDEDGAVLTPAAQEIYDYYLNRLDTLRQQVQQSTSTLNSSSSLELWENGLRQIYKEIIYDAFKALNIPISVEQDSMEVCFTGSLGREEATAYSDMDAFVIYQDDATAQQCRPAFTAVNNLCQRIFIDRNQLYPDPVGINPEKLAGTVTTLLGALKDDEQIMARSETVISIYSSSKPVLGHFEMGKQLRQAIKEDPELSEFVTPTAFYDRAITQFPAPRADEEEINIKEYILRPLDFILRGLREEFNLYYDDGGAVLSSAKTIDKLKGKIESDKIALIQRISEQALALRFQQHAAAEREQDTFERNAHINQLLSDVDALRQFAQTRRQRLQQPETTPQQAASPQTSAARSPERRRLSSQQPQQGIPPAAGNTAERPSFFSRNSKAIGMTAGVSAVVICFALVGLALMATGIFAPLGVGALAIALTVGIYAGGGLAACGLAYGATRGVQAKRRRQQAPSNADTATETPDNQDTDSHRGPLQALMNGGETSPTAAHDVDDTVELDEHGEVVPKATASVTPTVAPDANRPEANNGTDRDEQANALPKASEDDEPSPAHAADNDQPEEDAQAADNDDGSKKPAV